MPKNKDVWILDIKEVQRIKSGLQRYIQKKSFINKNQDERSEKSSSGYQISSPGSKKKYPGLKKRKSKDDNTRQKKENKKSLKKSIRGSSHRSKQKKEDFNERNIMPRGFGLSQNGKIIKNEQFSVLEEQDNPFNEILNYKEKKLELVLNSLKQSKKQIQQNIYTLPNNENEKMKIIISHQQNQQGNSADQRQGQGQMQMEMEITSLKATSNNNKMDEQWQNKQLFYNKPKSNQLDQSSKANIKMIELKNLKNVQTERSISSMFAEQSIEKDDTNINHHTSFSSQAFKSVKSKYKDIKHGLSLFPQDGHSIGFNEKDEYDLKTKYSLLTQRLDILKSKVMSCREQIKQEKHLRSINRQKQSSAVEALRLYSKFSPLNKIQQKLNERERQRSIKYETEVFDFYKSLRIYQGYQTYSKSKSKSQQKSRTKQLKTSPFKRVYK